MIFYTNGQEDFDDNGRWGLVGAIIILAMIWVVLGEKSKPLPVQVDKTPVVDTSNEDEDEEDMDLPEPVVKDELDGATLRERKLAKVRVKEEENEAIEFGIEEEEGLEEVVVTIEEVHVADEYVVEVSPQSIEDADIAASVRDKNDRHEKIRARIQERRRDQMAEIRASTARMWEEHSAGEDLVSLITSEDHKHNIIEEPEIAEAGHAYGATLVRIDESTILKLRVPLDEGFVAIDEKKSASAMPIPLPEGMPSPSDLGLLPLPPPPGASGALAALRDEIVDE
jgi:hypothetical protein